MSHAETKQALAKIMATQNKIQTYTGVVLGIVLVLYFFSFAQLIDKAPELFLIQLVSAFVFIVMLFFLKQLAFGAARMLLGNRAPYKQLFERLKLADMDKDPDALCKELEQR